MSSFTSTIQWVVISPDGLIYAWSNAGTRKSTIQRHVSDVLGTVGGDDAPGRQRVLDAWHKREELGDSVVKVRVARLRTKKPKTPKTPKSPKKPTRRRR